MKKRKIQIPSEIDFNLKYRFANDLLETPEDPQSVHNFCQSCMAWLENELNQPEEQWDVKSIVQVLGKTAAYMKMIRELDEAEQILDDVLDMCEKLDEVSFYNDFALQHLGKLNFDLGEYDVAFTYFEKALVLRKIKGNQELIDSTNFAISVTAAKLASNKF